jgi:glycosyltransferase involved in cell wall biosynthesis
MKIGFDISQTGIGKAGCGFYADSMIRAMLQLASDCEFSLYASFGDFFFDPRTILFNRHRGSNVTYGPRHLTRDAARHFWTQSALDIALELPDIVHANNFWCPVQLKSSRLVYTVYDLGFAINPDWTTEANRRGCFEGIFRSAVSADWIVAISEASRLDYLNIFPHFPANRIRVIYPCSRFRVDQVDRRPVFNLPVESGQFWLSVGTIEPRKNQLGLLRSYSRYLECGGKPIPLVFVGGKGWLMDHFENHVVSLGLAQKVVVAGYVSDEELIWLYRNCCGNLYPSHFEGFGLPILEGMQMGAPTIAASNSSLTEVTGTAAVLLDSEDNEGWARAMLRLVQNPHQQRQMQQAGIERSRQFTWANSAVSLLSLYSDVLASPKRILQ